MRAAFNVCVCLWIPCSVMLSAMGVLNGTPSVVPLNKILSLIYEYFLEGGGRMSLLSGILVAGCGFESKGARSFKSSLADVVYFFQSLDLGVRAFLWP